MTRTSITGFLFAVFLSYGASAAEPIVVNRGQWDRLSEPDRKAIEKILQDSRLDVTITPSDTADELRDVPEGSLDLRDVQPNTADWFGKITKWAGKAACELGCDASAVGGTAACGALSGGVAAAVCGGVLNKARPACKKLCK